MAWSSGKDSAWALHVARQEARLNVVGLVTTMTEPFQRVSMHGVRRELVEAQAKSVGLPLHEVVIPYPCSNEVYEARMADMMTALRRDGIEHVVFGDLFLADVRAYRERQLGRIGVHAEFPLWGRDTRELAREMVAAGVRTVVVCVDPRRLPESTVGRWLTREFLDQLPPGVDPCGENGEFHTFVAAGPMLSRPLEVVVGERVARDGFTFVDVNLAR